MQTASESFRQARWARQVGVLLAIIAIVGLGVDKVGAQSSYATPYTFTAFAGNRGFGSADGTGSGARFAMPAKVTVDSGGNVYVTDYANNTIRRVTPEGVVTTIAGLAGCPGSDDGMGRQARFSGPDGITTDQAGNLYVSDAGNHTVRKLTFQGTNWAVTTVAGLAGCPGTADGTGTAARFNRPSAVVLDGAGNLYVSDTINHTIRKMTREGAVTTLAGLAGTQGSVNGSGSDARFYIPSGMALGSDEALYVADLGNHTIRRVTLAGAVTTLAGLAGYNGPTDGTGTGARFYCPEGLCARTNGDLYVADRNNHTIRRVTSAGIVTTLAGLAGRAGTNDGFGSDAFFNYPSGVALDGAGGVYVADTSNCTIRKLVPAGEIFEVTTLVGLGMGTAGSADGAGPTARFNMPLGLTADADGYVYVADSGNNTVRKITPEGGVTTPIPAGTSFNGVNDVGVDSGGNIYVANENDQTIMKVSPGGMVSIVAGSSGLRGSSDGPAAAARFRYPLGVAVDSATNVYIADQGNNTIRKLTPDGIVSTLAGLAGNPGSVDGFGSVARFKHPYFLTVDSAGNVYVSDTDNCTIRKVTPAGQVTTIAGLAGNPGRTDGPGSSARFARTYDIAVDRSGRVYVVEDNALLRMLTPVGSQWNVTTLAGKAGCGGGTDGTGDFALFSIPTGVAVDGFGNVYVAEWGGHTIRKGFPASSVPQPWLQAQGMRAGQFGFDVKGFPNVWVFIETSTNLSQWKLDGTFLLEDGTNSFTSPDPLTGSRFYRARVR